MTQWIWPGYAWSTVEWTPVYQPLPKQEIQICLNYRFQILYMKAYQHTSQGSRSMYSEKIHNIHISMENRGFCGFPKWKPQPQFRTASSQLLGCPRLPMVLPQHFQHRIIQLDHILRLRKKHLRWFRTLQFYWCLWKILATAGLQ